VNVTNSNINVNYVDIFAENSTVVWSVVSADGFRVKMDESSRFILLGGKNDDGTVTGGTFLLPNNSNAVILSADIDAKYCRWGGNFEFYGKVKCAEVLSSNFNELIVHGDMIATQGDIRTENLVVSKFATIQTKSQIYITNLFDIQGLYSKFEGNLHVKSAKLLYVESELKDKAIFTVKGFLYITGGIQYAYIEYAPDHERYTLALATKVVGGFDEVAAYNSSQSLCVEYTKTRVLLAQNCPVMPLWALIVVGIGSCVVLAGVIIVVVVYKRRQDNGYQNIN
jgi:hypothetical protein